MISSFHVAVIGYVRSRLKDRTNAPRQGWEGAPDADLEITSEFALGIQGLEAGQEVWILTWLHEAQRSALKVHPRDEMSRPQTGVFATRSADRPNPIGLHRVSILKVEGNQLTVSPLEAIDGTPLLDIKPVLDTESLRSLL